MHFILHPNPFQAARNEANEKLASATAELERRKLAGEVASAGGRDVQGLLTSRSAELEAANAKIVKLQEQVQRGGQGAWLRNCIRRLQQLLEAVARCLLSF